jgi:hypothetical protein
MMRFSEGKESSSFMSVISEDSGEFMKKHKSWFWHGRFEGAGGGYIPPDKPLARVLYWFGNVIGRRFGSPA